MLIAAAVSGTRRTRRPNLHPPRERCPSSRPARRPRASWLLAGRADLQVVKERLGHGSITTEAYSAILIDD